MSRRRSPALAAPHNRATGPLPALAGTAAALVLLAGCGPSGIETVGEVDGFTACVEEAGASLEGSSDWDVVEQVEFFDQPGTLGCAVSELDATDLENALGDAFANPEDHERDNQDAPLSDGQLVAVHLLATETAAAHGEEAAVETLASVLAAGWFETNEDSWLHRRVAAFGILEATGQLQGYDDYLLRQQGSNLDDIDLVTHYLDDITGFTAETKALRSRLLGLADQIADTDPPAA